MTGKALLLDTNIVIGLFANEPSIINQLKSNLTIFIPSVVLGELFYGAELSGKREENLKKIQESSLGSLILDCSIETARIYGHIKSKLRIKGTPIPENDIWIAAIAIQNDLTLISRDNHFNFIDTLNIEKW